MVKIKRKSMDSIGRSPIRKSSYQAPSVQSHHSQGVPKEYQTFKKAPKKRGGFVFLLFLIFVAAIAGWFYWSNLNTESVENNSIEFSVSGPVEITSGDEVSYIVQYKNIDIVDMTQMKLSVFWPEGFYFDNASQAPATENAKTWLLADLAPGQTASIEINGQLVGHKDEDLRAVFNLDYQPSNFHSDFRAKGTVETKVIDNKLELTIEATDKTLVSTEQEIKVVYTNLTDQVLENIYLDIIYPDDWVSSEVTPEKEGQYWVTNLEPNKPAEILIKGNFAVDSRLEQSIVAEVGNMVNDNFRRLSRTEHKFVVVNPQFGFDLKINGLNGNQTVNWGDKLRYQLEVTNNSASDVADVQISALLTGGPINWSSLDTIGKYIEDRIVWTAEEDKELSLWPAGATKIFTWEVEVANDPQPERLIENIIQVNISGLNDWKQVSAESDITVGESLSFNNGIYWNLAGRRVGDGLLPPRVGEETQYLVVWSLPDSTGVFDTVTVETILPPNVTFVGEAETQEGVLEFDAEGRSITWQLDNFPDLLLPVTTSFMISIVPEAEDQGQAVTLLNPVTATASGIETVIVRSKILKTSDVVADSSEPVGIVQ